MNQIQQLHRYAQQAINQRQFPQAHQALVKVLSIDPKHADSYFLIGIMATETGQFDKAIELIAKAISLITKPNAEYLAHLAKAYALTNDHVNAKLHADNASKLSNENPQVADTLGVAYSKIGLHQLAIPHFKFATDKMPDNPQWQYNYGASLKFVGDFELAKRANEKTIELYPKYYKAHAALSSLGKIDQDNNRIPQLLELTKQNLNSEDMLYIGHALAREYEGIKDYDSAHQWLKKAKQQKLAELNYQFSDDQAMFDSLKQTFEQQLPCSDNHSEEAIFVVGMPRTGTTLVERIISNHSEVCTAGELQHFGLLLKQLSQTKTNKVIDPETIHAAITKDMNQLGKDYLHNTTAVRPVGHRFVDKMPLNVLYAGFIALALPKAKIICLDRNPLDTIVSNYRQLFAVNYSYYNYSYDFTSCTKFYIQFRELMNFWQQRFPDNFYAINYQQLVNNPEQEAKQLLTFCNLEWQPQCIDIASNTNPVATASAVQVRSAINNKSVGNWKKYDAYLDDAKALLTQANIPFE